MKRSQELTGSRIAVVVIVAVIAVAATAVVVSRRVRAADTAAAVATMSDPSAQVTAGELAQWILEKRQDYQLVDLRDPWHFDDYHIPTAVNVPRGSLFEPVNLKQLDRQKKIVVYSLGAGDGAKVQLLLSMKGYRAYALEDGIIGWWDEIMTPTSIRSARPSSSGYQQARQLREFFMSGTATAPITPAMPAPIAAPVPRPAETAPAAKIPSPAAKKAAPPPAKKAAPAEPVKSPSPPATPSEQEKNKLKLGTGCS